MKNIYQGVWTDSPGKIGNPGKSYYMGLAALCVPEVNHQHHEHSLSFSRKAMILTGYAKNKNGVWEVLRLKPQLQATIKKHQLILMPLKMRNSLHRVVWSHVFVTWLKILVNDVCVIWLCVTSITVTSKIMSHAHYWLSFSSQTSHRIDACDIRYSVYCSTLSAVHMLSAKYCHRKSTLNRL